MEAEPAVVVEDETELESRSGDSELDAASELSWEAEAIVKRHVRWTAVGGAIPFPLIDMVTVAGLQLKMLAALSRHYQVPFSEERGRSLVLCLLGSIAPYSIGAGLGSLIAKSIPLGGLLVGVASTSFFSATATSVMGNLFIDHLERGGSVHDVDPAAMRARFAQDYRQHQTQARRAS